jgi:O-antigen/teichoic acid export membrane protein
MIDQHTTLSEKFLKKGVRLYIFSFIISPIWYVIKIILSWELEVNEIWIIYGVISLISLISAFNDFGMNESLNHFIPDFVTKKRYDKVKSILVYTIIAQMSTWIIIASFFFFWADFIAENYFKTTQAAWILKVFAIYFLWINLFEVNTAFFSSIQNTLYSKLIDLFRMSFMLLATLTIFFLDLWSIVTYSYTWIIWLYMWIIFANSLFYIKYYKKYLTNENILWDKKLLKKIFKYAILVLISAQASTLLWQIDMQMIIYLLGTKDAWYYTNYLSIISIPFMIILPIFSMLFPVFSEMHSKWEYEKIRQVKEIFTKNFLVLWIAFNILFFVFAEIIAYILFWEKFIQSWTILKFSILFLIFNFLAQINWNILAWTWKIKERFKIVLIAIVINFITNLILINYIWVYWSALASWIWWFIIRILWEYYLWKQFYTPFNYKYLFKNIIFISIIWIISYFYIIPLFDNLSRFTSFLYLFIISIVWFSIFAFINKNEFKYFIFEIRKVVWKKY